MSTPFAFIKDYRRIELSVRNAIAAEFFIQMVNATFMNILPLYMTRTGYSDREIALFITLRFIGVFVLALPLGKLIKGKRIMPFFYISSICVPPFGLLIVLAIALKMTALTVVSLL